MTIVAADVTELRRAVERFRESQSAAFGRLPPSSRARRVSTDEAGALLATVLAAAADEGAPTSWGEVTDADPATFAACRAIGQQWQSTPTPALAALLAADPPLAELYAIALAELAAAAARVEPIDLRRVNAAAFVASAQLRALAPEHGQLPPSSVAPITRGIGQVAANQPSVASLVGMPGQAAASTAGAGAGAGAGAERSVAIRGLAAPPDAAAGTSAAEPHGAAASPQVTPASDSAPRVSAIESYAELLDQLDTLVGLDSVKADVRRQAELLRVTRIRGERGLRNPEITRHLVFTGNPGTGKTTVARLVAKIYCSLGLLEKGQLVELDRTGLVGGYLGQSEAKTAEAVERALGGVLFIDEAYALAGDQYGDAAIAVLVKAMEDHRDDLVLIAAGYTDRMQEFLDMNPGLSSRLRLTIFFPDYSDDELVEIFARLAGRSDYSPTDGCLAAMREVVQAQPRDEAFGNARFVRQCFEAGLVRQAWRLRDVASPTDEQLRTLTADDVVTPAA